MNTTCTRGRAQGNIMLGPSLHFSFSLSPSLTSNDDNDHSLTNKQAGLLVGHYKNWPNGQKKQTV